MIYRLGVLFCALGIFSCSDKSLKEEIIKQNYSYYDKIRNDSIKCIQVGIKYVDEKNALPFSMIKHELVDETPAKVKLSGKIITWENDSIFIRLLNDSIWAKTAFLIKKPKPFIGLNALFQGLIKMHPKRSFKVDGVLIQRISIEEEEK